MEEVEFPMYKKYRRCIICKHFTILQQCFNIFHTRLEKQQVLLSDFLKNVLNCSILIVMAPEFFVCKRCFKVCTELDVSLARCNQLQGVINSLFRNETCDKIENFTNIIENIKTETQLEEISCLDDLEEKNGVVAQGDFARDHSVGESSLVDNTTYIISDEDNADTWKALVEVPLHNQETPVGFEEIDPSISTVEPLGIKCIYEMKNCVVIMKNRKKVYLCNYCKFDTSKPGTMEKHLITHKTDPHVLCDVCGKRFKFMKTFKRHQNIHDKSRPFMCKLCPSRSNTINDLKAHEKYSHSNLKQFACGDCSYRTVKKRALLEHRRRHTGERPYCCPDCPYKAKDSGTLQRHRRLHSGLKKYHCTHCSFRATQKGTLTKHIRTHTGEKPFACPQCDYRSTIKNNLVDHIAARHSDSKPISCKLCSYVCKTRGSLSRHMSSHKNEKPYVCLVCGYKSNYSSGLRYHLYTRHPVDGQILPKSYNKNKIKYLSRNSFCQKKDISAIGEEFEFSDSCGSNTAEDE